METIGPLTLVATSGTPLHSPPHSHSHSRHLPQPHSHVDPNSQHSPNELVIRASFHECCHPKDVTITWEAPAALRTAALDSQCHEVECVKSDLTSPLSPLPSSSPYSPLLSSYADRAHSSPSLLMLYSLKVTVEIRKSLEAYQLAAEAIEDPQSGCSANFLQEPHPCLTPTQRDSSPFLYYRDRSLLSPPPLGCE